MPKPNAKKRRVNRVKGSVSRGRTPVKGFASRGLIILYTQDVFYVYVLRSQSDSGFYIGFSTNLRARLRQHQDGESLATKSRGPWKLIYYEAYLNQEDALGREKYLKSGSGRRFLRAQLRHYLRVKDFASRGSNDDVPKVS